MISILIKIQNKYRMGRRNLIVVVISLLLFSGCNQTTTLSGIDPKKFDANVESKPVKLYTLKNKNNLEATIRLHIDLGNIFHPFLHQ